jgi:hypothetical protein
MTLTLIETFVHVLFFLHGWNDTKGKVDIIRDTVSHQFEFTVGRNKR